MNTLLRASLSLLLPALAAAAVATPASGQASPAIPPDPQLDWRMPFRSPQSPLVPPEKLYQHLRTMYQLRLEADPATVSFDASGVEVVADPAWQAAREALDAVGHDAGYLSLVMRESRSAGDRALAFYGMFYEPDVDLAFQLIEHIPGEPSREIREAALQRAAQYVRVHLGARNPGDLAAWQQLGVGPAGEKPPKPGEFSHGFDPAPFHALLALEDPADRRQALWFLARCVEGRAELARPLFGPARPSIRAMLADGDRPQREAVIDFLAAVDPDAAREPAAADDPAAVEAWLDAVEYAVFPPVWRMSEGRFEIHPSADRDAIVAAGRQGLTDGSLGAAAPLQTTGTGPKRGFRITALPAPLDRLGFAVGDTIVAVDGQPVAHGRELLRALEAQARPGRVVLIEFVDGTGAARAIDFVLR